ncbi:MAG TPA: hypothetical protein VFB50_07595 [Chloroflexota bacterium]|nr:hypothetical protein [Chloroflexota bacterium]
MSVRLSDDSAVFLYDSVSGLPLLLECFADADDAMAFLDWTRDQADIPDLRRCRATELDALRGRFEEAQA